jgi:outer membrane receptor protein involved in Fe transport
MLLALLLTLTMAQADVTGTVTDTTGGAVSGASVILRTASGAERQIVTGPDGRFAFEGAPDGPGTLVVRAGGFAERTVSLAEAGPGRDIEVTLSPAGLTETVTVTPSRGEQRLANVPASVNILDSEEIQQSPAVVADDLLRRVPTFSLFRRTSSLSSHPTAQGVSLRGLGPSGVSRTLVMLDNVPFNDPFGGWVYWTRIPTQSIDRIEVVDGSSSSLYGNYAMGGVINIVSTRPARRTVELSSQYGNLGSPKLDFFGSDVWGRVGVAVDGSMFDTDGYPIVIANERGAVDTKASVNFQNVNVKLDYAASNRVSAFFRGGYFREERDNGKVSTVAGAPPLPEANDSTWKFAGGGVRIVLPDQSDLQARVFTDVGEFSSSFLAVPPAMPTRSIGRITLNQRVPTTSVGGLVQWSRAAGARNHVTLGTDWRWVDGDSNENVMDPATGTTVTLRRVSGGTQRSIGAFVQDVFTPMDRLVLTVSARVDRWRNYDAHNLETVTATGLPAAGNQPSLPDSEETVGSPRVAALYHVTDRVSAWGDMSWGFRAPTLNELYRQFRVGALLTLANHELGPERLVGGEAGLRIEPVRNLQIRTTWFDNRVKNAVANVTIGLNTQQRQNLGRTRVTGLQTDVDYDLAPEWRLSGGYLYNRARVTEFEANPELVGNFLPQVPRHRGSLQVAYTNQELVNVGLGLQFFGRQFDDDQNIRVVPGEASPGLPEYAMVDLTASRAISRQFEVFAGVQNLLDTEYIVGTLPTTIGAPRLFHAGVRVRLSGR